ncbi:MAG: TIGR04282 family arsenosugar biosynthesis glycosyltransferase [Pseudomonadota bacterium]
MTIGRDFRGGTITKPQLVLFTRFPQAGSCKTRLIPAIGEHGAARLHRQLTERTLSVLGSVGLDVTVAITGAETADFAAWLGEDFRLVQQEEGDLSARLRPFVEAAPVILFGADTPDLQRRHVKQAIMGLATNKVVIGPAEDGGYYLLALREPLVELIEDVPWSTAQVLQTTLERLERQGVRPLLLETLADCDTPEDLNRWPQLRHGTLSDQRGRPWAGDAMFQANKNFS